MTVSHTNTLDQSHEIILVTPAALPIASAAGAAANQAAAGRTFEDYQERQSVQTLRRQRADLALFACYLADASVIDAGKVKAFSEQLHLKADAWRGVTWGIVAGFVRWQLDQGYAVGSVNVRLATVKRYCDLAHQVGTIGAEEFMKIRSVRGYSQKQATRVNEGREQARKGKKKAQSVSISADQVEDLKSQPDTSQGRRDALLMCLLLDHGLRCGEVAQLQVTDVDLRTRTFTFYRSKVAKTQTHRMTFATYRAAVAYFEQDAPAIGPLLRGSRRSKLMGSMSARAITKRVRELGLRADLVGLSPHDCRHWWATAAIRAGTDIKSLQDAGGWASPNMPLRYAESARIANEGVKLE